MHMFFGGKRRGQRQKSIFANIYDDVSGKRKDG